MDERCNNIFISRPSIAQPKMKEINVLNFHQSLGQ